MNYNTIKRVDENFWQGKHKIRRGGTPSTEHFRWLLFSWATLTVQRRFLVAKCTWAKPHNVITAFCLNDYSETEFLMCNCKKLWHFESLYNIVFCFFYIICIMNLAYNCTWPLFRWIPGIVDAGRFYKFIFYHIIIIINFPEYNQTDNLIIQFIQRKSFCNYKHFSVCSCQCEKV